MGFFDYYMPLTEGSAAIFVRNTKKVKGLFLALDSLRGTDFPNQ